jgi:DNA repair ATPase RecN
VNGPKPEHRITAVEKRVTKLEGAIEELSSDTSEEFKALRQEVLQGFKQAHAYIQEHIEDVMATKEDIRQLDVRFEKVGGRLDRIEKHLEADSKVLNEILRRLPDKL